MRRVSQGLHVAGEVAVGVLAVLALGALFLGWRLSQGPIDVTPLLGGHASFEAGGLRVHIGGAALAWEGFGGGERPLDVVVRDVTADAADGSLRARVARAHVAVSVTQAMLGRVRPTEVDADGVEAVLRAPPGEPVPVPVPVPAPVPAVARATPSDVVSATHPPPWLGKLRHLRVGRATVRGTGLLEAGDVLATATGLDLSRTEDGGPISARMGVALSAGDVHATLDARAVARPDGTEISLDASPLSPAALARLIPSAAGLGALDAPVGLKLTASLGADLSPQRGTLAVAVGPGRLRAGRGSVALAGVDAVLSATPGALRLDKMRIALAPAAGGTGAPPPVFTGSANAVRAGGRLHVAFGLAFDAFPLADLGRYWPVGTGGGARVWLVGNISAGSAHDAHVEGTLDGAWPSGGAPEGLAVTALAGGGLADDVSLTWLKPVPGLTHGHVRCVVEGPDSLIVIMDKGGQGNLTLAPEARIRFTKLQGEHQFGDIDVSLAGPLTDALAILNHPRLHLLARSGLTFTGAAGDLTARLKLHVPLEDKVTIEQIPISAQAELHGVHLGAVAAGHDLDQGELTLSVTNDALKAGGTGALSGIPARLSLDMDFRDGPDGQVQQHATAQGLATADQMTRAGMPDFVGELLTDGQAGLRAEYAARRGGQAELKVDADLAQAAVRTPIGWNKAVGLPAALGGRLKLTDGHLVGVDMLHAEGPGLSLVSRADLSHGQRVVMLDKMEVGRTRAHGRLSFPHGGAVRVELAGPVLDVSPVLETDETPRQTPEPPAAAEAPETPGQAWAARLSFGQIVLAKGKTMAPFSLDAASDGLKITHAQLRAGEAGQVAASITPRTGGREMRLSAKDAGAGLRALGMPDHLAGGQLVLQAAYDDTKPGRPLAGTATLSEFSLKNAPVIGRLLQALTLYGVADILRGPGLHFSKLVAPFMWRAKVLHLADARAFSASLGITAQGDLDLRRHTAEVTGTVVPAYFFNQLPGNLPLVGPIFSPEKGGGVFAARYSVRGKLSDPSIGVNPLSALTPGFLREGFGLFVAPAGEKK